MEHQIECQMEHQKEHQIADFSNITKIKLAGNEIVKSIKANEKSDIIINNIRKYLQFGGDINKKFILTSDRCDIYKKIYENILSLILCNNYLYNDTLIDVIEYLLKYTNLNINLLHDINCLNFSDYSFDVSLTYIITLTYSYLPFLYKINYMQHRKRIYKFQFQLIKTFIETKKFRKYSEINLFANSNRYNQNIIQYYKNQIEYIRSIDYFDNNKNKKKNKKIFSLLFMIISYLESELKKQKINMFLNLRRIIGYNSIESIL